ncbi:MAG TPA: DNA/RNA nuclease SfsA [Thermoplasmata archaeon]|nr:DNA/RNA nuclease SfsA [Thermoplasmata archaeon]
MSAVDAFEYDGPLLPVRFLARPNRYLAQVDLNGRPVAAHVPNPGRMTELLVPGATRGWVVRADAPGRSTQYDLVAVEHHGMRVSVDSRVANRMVGRGLLSGRLREFGPGPWRSERSWGGSRFDFGVPGTRGGMRALVEVKSSNLRIGEYASFPDAPTVRGTRHLEHLRHAARRGIRAGVLFLIQRPDVRRFAPNGAMDPEFADALRRAALSGVVLRAYTSLGSGRRVEWGSSVPVSLDNPPEPPSDNL